MLKSIKVKICSSISYSLLSFLAIYQVSDWAQIMRNAACVGLRFGQVKQLVSKMWAWTGTNLDLNFAQLAKVLKCLNQCFAWLRSWKSVSSKTAVDPASKFCEFETLFPRLKSCKTLIWEFKDRRAKFIKLVSTFLW